MTTVRCTIEYDGTGFCGFQYQPQLRSVAGELERAFGQLFDEPLKVTAAGRTDAGVHASGQVISFSTTRSFPFERLMRAANSILPDDIAVLSAEPLTTKFSARFDALDRTYWYFIVNRPPRSALAQRFAWHVYNTMDVEAAARAARPLLGEHDFVSFCGVLPESGPTRRAVTAIDVRRQGELVRVSMTADGFLHHMVRNVVGTLTEVATGQRPDDSIATILAAKDRRASGATAPARGLFLVGVRYLDLDSFRAPTFLAAFA